MKLQFLIPQYNETDDIVKNMLDSIEIQQGIDFKEIEVLIGNDGSDIKLSEDLLSKYSYSIKYFQYEHTSPAGTRQKLFDVATADYVMFCDADDMLLNILSICTIFSSNRRFIYLRLQICNNAIVTAQWNISPGRPKKFTNIPRHNRSSLNCIVIGNL